MRAGYSAAKNQTPNNKNPKLLTTTCTIFSCSSDSGCSGSLISLIKSNTSTASIASAAPSSHTSSRRLPPLANTLGALFWPLNDSMRSAADMGRGVGGVGGGEGGRGDRAMRWSVRVFLLLQQGGAVVLLLFVRVHQAAPRDCPSPSPPSPPLILLLQHPQPFPFPFAIIRT